MGGQHGSRQLSLKQSLSVYFGPSQRSLHHRLAEVRLRLLVRRSGAPQHLDTSYLLPHGVQSVETSLTLVFEQFTDVDRRLFRKMISPRPLINSGTMILLNGRQLPMQREGWLLVALRQT